MMGFSQIAVVMPRSTLGSLLFLGNMYTHKISQYGNKFDIFRSGRVVGQSHIESVECSCALETRCKAALVGAILSPKS